jgi:hypothetical protein
MVKNNKNMLILLKVPLKLIGIPAGIDLSY